MKALEQLVRWSSPKRYVRWMLRRAKRERSEKLKAAQSLPFEERRALASTLDGHIYEWSEWLRELDDDDLVREAQKMDVYLDDIPPVQPAHDHEDPHYVDGHYRIGDFANQYFHPEVRKALVKAMRERAPVYRKERREVWDFWLKFATLVVGAIGAATGLIAVWKK